MKVVSSHKQRDKPTEFSKRLLVQESALIWLLTLAFIGLAYLCVFKDYTGSLPWLTVALTGAWTAYGVSQACYYNKAKAENTVGGVVYEMAIKSKDTEASI